MKRVSIKLACCMNKIESLFVHHMEIKLIFYFGSYRICEMSIKYLHKEVLFTCHPIASLKYSNNIKFEFSI